MRKFNIMHATGPDRFSEVTDQPRKLVGQVEATSLSHAFQKSQNIHKSWNDSKTRSTSVGDVIVDIENNTEHMVCGLGFIQL